MASLTLSKWCKSESFVQRFMAQLMERQRVVIWDLMLYISWLWLCIDAWRNTEKWSKVDLGLVSDPNHLRKKGGSLRNRPSLT